LQEVGPCDSAPSASLPPLGDYAAYVIDATGTLAQGEEPEPTMYGRENSDTVIVAAKLANRANDPAAETSAGADAAESVERRAGAKGNTRQHGTHWTQSQDCVAQVLEHIESGPRFGRALDRA